jgi:4-amino-4-deoxy-L-arabinose transferase-like glycosyltransferase
MSRLGASPWIFRACLIVVLIWAGIYLPALSLVQLEHEEPRRALPALHMLATGDWLVPRVGASPYLSKPPLLNWMIAISFKLTGGQSEWAARLPSVVATLTLAIVAVVVAGGNWLGPEGGLLAAIFFLTNLTMIETGRLAEIEALYVSLTGIALILWMTSWRQAANNWRLWLSPAPFLALAMLTKGPTHLVFFYGVVVPVLIFGKNVRAMCHPAHWLALALTFGGFLCWAIPASYAVGQYHPGEVWGIWWSQISSRGSASPGQHFHLLTWLLNGPQTLKNFLPWTLLLPLLWRREITAKLAAPENPSSREQSLFRGARWGMVFTGGLMSLLPNGSPRYLYPLLIVPCLLLARALTIAAGCGCPAWLTTIWRRTNLALLGIVGIAIVATPFVTHGNRWFFLCTLLVGVLGLCTGVFCVRRPAPEITSNSPTGVLVVVQQALTSAVIAVLVIAVYALAVVPRINSVKGNRPREVAASIREAIPTDAKLWVDEDIYGPFWYYLEPEVRYFRPLREIPPQAQYFLLPAAQTGLFLRDARWRGVPPKVIKEAIDNERRVFVLLARRPSSPDANRSSTD